jgi:hypothetical protein
METIGLMGLLDRLKDWGCRLGLIRTLPLRAGAPAKITPRVTSLKDLKTEVLQQDLQHVRDELSPSLDKVFKEAGVGPRAWTIERLRDLLHTESLRTMDRQAARQAILKSLAADSASVDDLVQDARARDKALDESEGRALALFQRRQDHRRQQKEALERQMGQLNEARKALDAAEQDEQQTLRQWQAHKAEYAKDMAWALGFLADKPSGFQAEPKKSSAG